MSRVRDFLERIDDPALPPLPPDPEDEPLLQLLVHLAVADGTVQGDEFALLQRVRPDLEQGALLAWAAEAASRPLDMTGLARFAAQPPDRLDLLRLGARMVGMDGDVGDGEASRLGELARKLGLTVLEARAALDEVVARGGPVDERTLRDALRHMRWRHLVPSFDPPTVDLADLAPEGARLVCSMSRSEPAECVAALYVEGLVAEFDQGAAFVSWPDLAMYTRVPVVDAAFHLHTREGKALSMSASDLRDLGALIDLAYGRSPMGAPA